MRWDRVASEPVAFYSLKLVRTGVCKAVVAMG